MAGLVPAIHVFADLQDVDARHKAEHDGVELLPLAVVWPIPCGPPNEGQAMSDVHSAIDSLSDDAAALFDQVRAATADIAGVTRHAFGAKETAAGEIVIDFCRRHGLAASFDAVANLAVTLDAA